MNILEDKQKMNILRKIFKTSKIPSIIDPLIGKTVIHFKTHGCMGTIHEFDYIGTIIDTTYPDDQKFYIVKILKDRGGELRDENVKNTIANVYALSLQDLGGDFLIAYD